MTAASVACASNACLFVVAFSVKFFDIFWRLPDQITLP
jgi:hypothetical protein